MANPSVTNTFTNGTTADATQVNTNFNDLINGMTDGTKDFTIAALTANGTATFNGSVTLGNGSVDDITFTGSVASNVVPKTDATYNLGSASIGWAGIFLGGNSNTVKLAASASLSADYTFTFPTSGGTAGYIVRCGGSGTTEFVPGGSEIRNLGLAASVGSNALTIALKGANGSDPSGTNPVDVAFRNATAATGTPVQRVITGALSLTISSGSTLGHSDGTDHFVYVYLVDNAGTILLAASSQALDEGTLQSTTSEGGAGGADTWGTLYASSGVSSKAIRLIARLKVNQTTAGTWASAPSEIAIVPFSKFPRNEIIVRDGNGHGSTNTKIRRFSTTLRNFGTAITYADSAANGASFTINEAGVYSMHYQDRKNGVGDTLIGITLNTDEGTTAIQSVTGTEVLTSTSVQTGGVGLNTSITAYLNEGDVVTPHTNEQPDSTGFDVRFTIVKVA